MMSAKKQETRARRPPFGREDNVNQQISQAVGHAVSPFQGSLTGVSAAHGFSRGKKEQFRDRPPFGRDDTHPALAELFEDLVVRNDLADHS